MNCEISSYFPPSNESQSKEIEKIDIELIKKQITDHVNLELKRFSRELNSIKNEGHF